MDRPSWNETYISMCKTLSKRSTCLRIQTASIIVKNNIIVSVGYNGVGAEQEHCCDFWRKVYNTALESIAYVQPLTHIEKICLSMKERNVLLRIGRYDDTEIGYQCEVKRAINRHRLTFEEFLNTGFFHDKHHNWSNKNELHGEMNAILFAGRHGISLEGSTIYTIYSPCIHCAKSIYASGIKKVYYKDLYHRDMSGIRFLRDKNVEIDCYITNYQKT